MSRTGYQLEMEQRLRDLSLQIESIQSRFEANLGLPLAEQIKALTFQRDRVREKLVALCDEPDGTWEDLRGEVEEEWDALVQDFEERVASLVL